MIKSGWDKQAAFATATRARKKMAVFGNMTRRMIKLTGCKKAPGLRMEDLG